MFAAIKSWIFRLPSDSHDVKFKINRTTILYFLYEFKSSLTLEEQHMLRVFANGVSREIFGLRGDEAIEE
jgi:hypothetical protein